MRLGLLRLTGLRSSTALHLVVSLLHTGLVFASDQDVLPAHRIVVGNQWKGTDGSVVVFEHCFTKNPLGSLVNLGSGSQTPFGGA
jgi:hypothetical protein